MEQQEINYQDVIDLGFKRGEMNDSVHQKQYGYDDFWVERKLGKRHTASWENKTRYARVTRHDKGGYIVYTWLVRDLEELKALLALLGGKS